MTRRLAPVQPCNAISRFLPRLRFELGYFVNTFCSHYATQVGGIKYLGKHTFTSVSVRARLSVADITGRSLAVHLPPPGQKHPAIVVCRFCSPKIALAGHTPAEQLIF